MSRLYVGSLSRDTTEDTLRATLGQDGRTVTHVNIKKNGTTGKPRGFAFVDMGSQAEAEAVIAGLNGTTIDSRKVKINFAKALSTRSDEPREYGSGPYSGGRRGGRGGRR